MSDDRVAELEEQFQQFKQDLLEDRDRFRSEVLLPRIEDLEEQRDDAREERAELKAQVEMQSKRIQDLERRLQGLVGLAEDETGGPEKRKTDLRMGLIRRAEAKSDANAGRAAMHYKEVQHYFAEIGHGDVSKPDCYKAMEDAAAGEGYKLNTKQKNGREVKAVVVDLEKLPSSAADATSRNPTTPSSAKSSHEPPNTEDNVASD